MCLLMHNGIRVYQSYSGPPRQTDRPRHIQIHMDACSLPLLPPPSLSCQELIFENVQQSQTGWLCWAGICEHSHTGWKELGNLWSHGLASGPLTALLTSASNVSGFGMSQKVGHLDFYPNGGKHMPGCQKNTVSTIIDINGIWEGMYIWKARQQLLHLGRKQNVWSGPRSTEFATPAGCSFRPRHFQNSVVRSFLCLSPFYRWRNWIRKVIKLAQGHLILKPNFLLQSPDLVSQPVSPLPYQEVETGAEWAHWQMPSSSLVPLPILPLLLASWRAHAKI